MNAEMIGKEKLVPRLPKREIKEIGEGKENNNRAFKSMIQDASRDYKTKELAEGDKKIQCDGACFGDNEKTKVSESEETDEAKIDTNILAQLGLSMHFNLDIKEPVVVLHSTDEVLNDAAVPTSKIEMTDLGSDHQMEAPVNGNLVQALKDNKPYDLKPLMQTSRENTGTGENGVKVQESEGGKVIGKNFADQYHVSENENPNNVRQGLGDEDIQFKLKDVNKNSAEEDKILKEGLHEDSGSLVQKNRTITNHFDVVEIKVGDVQTEDKWQALSEKIAKEIIIKVNNNKKEFEVQLAPKELGNIHIKILFENGKAVVSMLCSNEKTLSLLAEKAKTIGGIIETNTGYQSVVHVEKEKDGNNQRWNESFDGRGQKGNQQDSHQKNNKNHREANIDFIHKIRLGMVSQTDSELI